MSLIPAVDPILPFLGTFPGGRFHVTQMIRIYGQMYHNADRFIVNLQKYPTLNGSSDISLHLSVRPHEHTIVRNHKINQNWAHEERAGGCPIQPGTNFQILILADYAYYRIAINGVHFATFNHRIPFDGNANFLAIDGDCSVSFIGLENDNKLIPPSHQYATAPMSYPGHPY